LGNLENLDFSLTAIIQATLLSASLSLDAFAAAFAYGCMGTKIPVKSATIINIVCTLFLAIALIAGAYAKSFIPPIVGSIVCFLVLMTIGVIKLVQGIRNKPTSESLKKSESPESRHNTLRPIEAAIIAAGLSLDGLAAGFGAALGGVNSLVMLGSSLLIHMVAIPLGCILGRQLSLRSGYNIAWLGGAVIIVLAFLQIVA